MPQLLGEKTMLRGKPPNFRRGTRLPQPGGGQAGVPPVERHGQDAHATAGDNANILLYLSAPLR